MICGCWLLVVGRCLLVDVQWFDDLMVCCLLVVVRWLFVVGRWSLVVARWLFDVLCCCLMFVVVFDIAVAIAVCCGDCVVVSLC